MDPNQISTFVRQHHDAYFTNVNELLIGLKVPKTLLGRPKETMLVVNKHSKFLIMSNGFFDYEELLEIPGDDEEPAASFVPSRNSLASSIRYCTGALREELNTINCERRKEPLTDLQCRDFISLLLAHELVHVAMMGKFINKSDPIAFDWVHSTHLRFIHEAIALKVCEKVHEEIATAEVKAAYIAHVHALVQEGHQSDIYGPYFELHDSPDDDFWSRLVQNNGKTIEHLLRLN